MAKKPTIYLDNAATTPIDKAVLKAMLPYLGNDFGNASSLHSPGQKARAGVEKARKQTADFLNCQTEEIIFTGSATEADNMAVLGTIKAVQKNNAKKPHIVTSEIEHPAVLEACGYLQKNGAEVSYLPVGKNGIVKLADVKKSIKPNTVLVSIMYANNEIGSIQPVAEIGKLLKAINRKLKTEIRFHTDAAQAANYLDCDARKLGVDLLTLSGHKIYGPKGVGVLYVKKGAAIEPVTFGGHQENGLRPGTENTAAIAGFGTAIEMVSANRRLQTANLTKLRNKLIDGILKTIPKTSLNGSRESRLPNNANISFSGVEGESVLFALNGAGVAVSTGSACASHKLEPSHVLLALGLPPEKAHGSIRFSLGRQTTSKEIDYVLKILPGIIKRLRKISPIK
ncbi:MAG: cysteine desulfurase [Patescibacteria group bacterium]|nr:cysteine desulfurase [Patescibacteria group bacterium]